MRVNESPEDDLEMDIPTVCEDCVGRLQLTETQSLEERWVPSDEWDVSLHELERSASEGCAICKIHLEAVSSEGQRELLANLPEISVVASEKSVVINHMWLAKGELMMDLSDLTRLMVSDKPYDVFAHPGDPAADRISNRREKPPKTGIETMNKVKDWIKHCTAGHDHARTTRCGPFAGAELPPRVIEVSGDDDASIHVKLVEPESGSHARYVALSYCWGPAQYNTLTTIEANYHQHCLEIPVAKTAKTLRDAMLVTRQLGLQYLWIDALCIIQDSDSDKDLQISKMRSIFENAFITIVAAAGENASSGFLEMPTQQNDIAFQLPYRHPEDEEGSMGTIYAIEADTKQSMKDQPINLRAWTLEERLLSRRKIIYFEDRVAWECYDISLADSGEIENMGDDMRIPARILHAGDARFTSGPFTADELEWAVHTEWLKNIEWYTTRELTRPSDKLRAVGGIAQKYQTVLQVEYLAGLWQGHVLAGLLWRRIVDNEGDSLRARPAKYRAPSWSWASIDGKIEYSWPDREEGSLEVARLGHAASIATKLKPDIVVASVQLSSPNRAFGGVVGGILIVDGMVKWVQGQLRGSTYGELGRTLSLALYSGRDRGPAVPGNIDEGFLECWPYAEGALIAGNVELCLLGLTGAAEDTTVNDMYSKNTTFVIRGILLVGKSEGRFARIGLFEMWDHGFDRLLGGFKRQRLEIE
ncbi:putative Heterokaryon incompatibility domain-containing protein [Seiridium cardinale]